MATVSFSPFDDTLLRLQAALDRLLENPRLGLDLGPSSPGVFPPINIFGDADGIVIRAEVPGIKPEQLSVVVEPGRLTISGERAAEQRNDGSYHRRERQYGGFSRIVQLPDEYDPDQASAECRNGLLTVRVAKREAAKPRQIAVRRT